MDVGRAGRERGGVSSVVTVLVVDYIIFAVGTSGLLRPALALAESGA